MGCAGSSQKSSEGTVKKLRKPKPWKHTQSITRMQLRQMRDEFWDTAPHYGGQKEEAYDVIHSNMFLRVFVVFFDNCGSSQLRDPRNDNPQT
ncbi:hypothetical protein AMTRI_Chr01g110290 [Amborella trichopoda]